MYLKSVVYTGRQAAPAPHVYVVCMCQCVSCRLRRGLKLCPPPLSSSLSPSSPFLLLGPCVFVLCTDRHVSLGKTFPSNHHLYPLHLRVWSLSFLSWRLPPLSPTSPSDLTDLTGPSLSLSLPLLAAPIHSLALLFFLVFPPLKFAIFVLLVPCWPFSPVYLSSLVGLLFPPSKELFSAPNPPLPFIQGA